MLATTAVFWLCLFITDYFKNAWLLLVMLVVYVAGYLASQQFDNHDYHDDFTLHHGYFCKSDDHHYVVFFVCCRFSQTYYDCYLFFNDSQSFNYDNHGSLCKTYDNFCCFFETNYNHCSQTCHDYEAP